jgi:hypothetical protein
MTLTEILSIILGSSLLTSIVSFFLHRKTEEIGNEVKTEFEALKEKLSADLKWKQDSCRVMGRIYFHLNRSKSAGQRYYRIKEKNKFLEDLILESNKNIRDLILEEGSLIHPDLTDEANKLVEHYDTWLEKYHSLRVKNKEEHIHVFVGPDGYPFPKDAEKRFKDFYIKLWKELYSADNRD